MFNAGESSVVSQKVADSIIGSEIFCHAAAEIKIFFAIRLFFFPNEVNGGIMFNRKHLPDWISLVTFG